VGAKHPGAECAGPPQDWFAAHPEDAFSAMQARRRPPPPPPSVLLLPLQLRENREKDTFHEDENVHLPDTVASPFLLALQQTHTLPAALPDAGDAAAAAGRGGDWAHALGVQR